MTAAYERTVLAGLPDIRSNTEGLNFKTPLIPTGCLPYGTSHRKNMAGRDMIFF